MTNDYESDQRAVPGAEKTASDSDIADIAVESEPGSQTEDAIAEAAGADPDATDAAEDSARAESAHTQRPDLKMEPLRQDVQALVQRVACLEDKLNGIVGTIDRVPQQLRVLRDRVSTVTNSVNDVRVRELLHGTLYVFDLLEQMADAAEPDSTVRRDYETVRNQVAQILATNDLVPIDTAGEFDANLHRAVGAEPTDDLAKDGQIQRVRRVGFRTPNQVLRYAEVVTWKHRDDGAELNDQSPTHSTQSTDQDPSTDSTTAKLEE